MSEINISFIFLFSDLEIIVCTIHLNRSFRLPSKTIFFHIIIFHHRTFSIIDFSNGKLEILILAIS